MSPQSNHSSLNVSQSDSSLYRHCQVKGKKDIFFDTLIKINITKLKSFKIIKVSFMKSVNNVDAQQYQQQHGKMDVPLADAELLS